jgi:hypothetical protein
LSVAGYSGTPLGKKLGIKPGILIRVVDPPIDYLSLVGPLPEETKIAPSDVNGLDLVHVFTTKRSGLLKAITRYKEKIKPAGAIWVSWPKKASGIPSEVTEDTVREVALPLGLVDIKVCAVDDVWSGLKLVIRKENRA